MFNAHSILNESFNSMIHKIIVRKRTIPDKGGFRKIADITYYSESGEELSGYNDKFDSHVMSVCHVLNRELKLKYPIILICSQVGSKLKINRVNIHSDYKMKKGWSNHELLKYAVTKAKDSVIEIGSD